MDFTEYRDMWSYTEYVQRVELLAKALKADGCTGVPDFYLLGCLEHDIAYHTHCDPWKRPLTKDEADKRLRYYVRMRSPFGILSPMSWWRWAAVTWWAQKSWAHTPEPFPEV